MGFNKDIIEILKENLPVYHRAGQGGTFPYVKGEDVIKQLNKAFGHAWSSHVVKHEELHGQILVQVMVSVNDEAGHQVSHSGFGSARIPKTRDGEILEIGNAYKSAFTNALKKAAEQFGVGLQAEDDDDAKPAPAPRASVPAPRAPTPTPVAARPAPRPYQPQPAPAATQQAAAPRPAPAPVATATPHTAGMLTDKPLSDVQKNALKNLAKYRGVAEETLVTGALKGSSKTSFEQLTEKEAVDVIRHANSLPKK